MPLRFVTLGDELVEYAEAFAAKMRGEGFTVRAEFDDGSMPRAPTVMGSIGNARHFADVCEGVVRTDIERWVSYCRSRSSETYFSLVVHERATLRSELLVWLREQGIGIFIAQNGAVTEIAAPRDLALNLALPNLDGESRSLRRMLAQVYAAFDRGDWFNGFRDACQILEAQARRHLKRLVSDGSVSFSRNGQPKVYTASQIQRMTQGQLAGAYAEIVIPTAKEQTIARALAHLNPDRIGAVHRADDRSVRRRLRQKVGTHMWMLVNGLRELS